MTAGWWGGWDADATVAQAMAYGASQDSWELARALEAVRSALPRAVLEIGCDRGGTLYAWRQTCERVYGITLADNGYESGGSGLPLVTHGAQVFIGSSRDPLALEWILAELDGSDYPLLDVLVLDGSHLPDDVRADLATYGPLVRHGGLILLHDVTPSSDPRSQVWRVWPDLAARYETEEITNTWGGFGWGVIRVRPGDRFETRENTSA